MKIKVSRTILKSRALAYYDMIGVMEPGGIIRVIKNRYGYNGQRMTPDQFVTYFMDVPEIY